MKKSVYSLVLMDDVVDAIDQLAYSMNTSRSNLINQILAEHVSLSTPEMRMRDIFHSMEQLMNNTFQILDQPSDSMLSLRSQLKYKYKPTIRYSLELFRNQEEAIGQLRISMRTQNQQLIQSLDSFFRIWDQLEKHYLGSYFPEDFGIRTDGSRYIRTLYLPTNKKNCSSDELGQAVGAYVNRLDQMIKIYFSNLDLPAYQLTSLLEQQFRKDLAEKDIYII